MEKQSKKKKDNIVKQLEATINLIKREDVKLLGKILLIILKYNIQLVRIIIEIRTHIIVIEEIINNIELIDIDESDED